MAVWSSYQRREGIRDMPSILQVSGGGLTSGSAVIVTPTGFTDGSSVASVGLPTGGTTTRSGTPTVGSLRFNTDTESLEFWSGTEWRALVNSFVTTLVRGNFPDTSLTSGFVSISEDVTLAPWAARVNFYTIRITQAGTYLVTAFVVAFAGTRPAWDCIVELRDVTVPGSPVTLVRARHGADLRIDPLDTPYISLQLSTVVAPTASMDLAIWIDPLGFGDVHTRGDTDNTTGMAIRKLR